LDRYESPLLQLVGEIDKERKNGVNGGLGGGPKEVQAEAMLVFVFEAFPELVEKAQSRFPSLARALGEVGRERAPYVRPLKGEEKKKEWYRDGLTKLLAGALRAVGVCVCVCVCVCRDLWV
jgi:hypothetical protein